MAGRGTDIILGGNPEFLARKAMEKEGYDAETIAYASSLIPTDDQNIIDARKVFEELNNKFAEERKEEQERVREHGGLYIIGTERHESRRIDNQLRGRSGRQGDPGITQFCISLEDELMRLFGGERMKGIVDKLGVEEDEPIESGMVSRSIENAQKKVEGRNFSIRKYVLQYDNVMNKQREIIYDERRKVLFGENLKTYIMNMTEALIKDDVDPIVMESKYAEEWDLETLNNKLKKICSRFEGISYEKETMDLLTPEQLMEDILEEFHRLYDEKEAEVGEEIMRELERRILLQIVDSKWMDHIDAMDQLKNGIGLRGLGGQDPAGAYAEEGFDMFEEMTAAIQEETVKFCYNVTVQTTTERKRVIGGGNMREEFEDEGNYIMAQAQAAGGGQNMQDMVPERENVQETVRRATPKVGRNDPCPCGSGKKYKYCCGR
jgi:preprotein translocase subunit SecA